MSFFHMCESMQGVHGFCSGLFKQMTSLPDGARLIVRPIMPKDIEAMSFMAEEFEDYLNSLVQGRHGTSRMTKEVFLRDGFGNPPGFHGMILERNDTPLGYLLYCFTYNTDLASRTIQVIDLFVKVVEQGKGFGRLLMKALIPVCQAVGIPAITVSVWKQNAPAQRFYKNLGAVSGEEEVLWWPAENG